MDDLTGARLEAQKALDVLDQITKGRVFSPKNPAYKKALKDLAAAMDEIYGPIPEYGNGITNGQDYGGPA